VSAAPLIHSESTTAPCPRIAIDDQPWYAVHVRSRHEKVVANQIQAKGMQTLLPCYTSVRRSSGPLPCEVPLFPGYVFCQLDIERRLPVLVVPGVIRFVGIGKQPVPVDDMQMAALRLAIGSGLKTRPWPFLSQGDLVQVERGPLRGVEGLFVADKGSSYVVISISLLQRSLCTVVSREDVRPIRRWTSTAAQASSRA
jgi:transcription antitermination factor NusG